ncbi:NAD(P)/FAD-dependent oxidoreductase [Streptomyces sp. SHP 1-2]|uniref:NAD(P)/FAD-dependent oxidoreductase n=1 Tax=Streptomyces sp. SHP 1-2 TaxID=2769489 RepID=UPI002237619D|nr:FAD/NAD(P)-binding oxidoreductase [Streptomyces sp. SHP 1-2]MCW5253548.1 NAD(P)/FAD-dependent oxidoreductase [Streptomyces sp. SHP 1-2]
MVCDTPQTVVVAGGSLAGHTVVTELDRRGFTGEVVWVTGAEGVAPYSKPALSKEYMQEKVTLDTICLPPVPTDSIRLRRVDRAVCERLDPDADRVLVDGEWIPFDALFVCTGMRPRVPAEFAGLPGVHPLRTLADARAVRDRLAGRPRTVVIGAGLIGCETAASLRSLGLPVELVVQTGLPLEPLLGEELGRFCLDQHHTRGVTTRLSATVTALTPDGPGGAVTVDLDDGTSTTGDLVILGLGAVPALDWLQGAGLDLTDGLVCDAGLRTARGNVYAAGDIANWPHPLFGRRLRVEHWSNASAQARHAVGTWAADQEGGPHREFADIPYFWSDQYGLKYQMLGHARGHDEVRVDTAGPGGHPFVTYHREGRLVAAAGVNATRAVMGMRTAIQTGAGPGPLPAGTAPRRETA